MTNHVKHITETKTGPQLDARLCELLEMQPADMAVWGVPSVTPLGFWTQDIDWNWQPIPVSTDWRAMGKAVEELGHRNHDITIEWMPRECKETSFVELAWGIFPDGEKVYASGISIPHAFTLAAIEALEKQAKGKK